MSDTPGTINREDIEILPVPVIYKMEATRIVKREDIETLPVGLYEMEGTRRRVEMMYAYHAQMEERTTVSGNMRQLVRIDDATQRNLPKGLVAAYFRTDGCRVVIQNFIDPNTTSYEPVEQRVALVLTTQGDVDVAKRNQESGAA